VQRFFAFALCAGLACFLAVVYTLLHLDWAESARPGDPPAAVGGPDR
jgi:hypothetical protein